MAVYSIKNMDKLTIIDGSKQYCGASQKWYSSFWKRMSGCGPTNASHLAYYLSRTRSDCAALVLEQAEIKKDFCILMNKMWNYVTPGMKGVNSTELFMRGLEKYSKERGFRMIFEMLEVSRSDSEYYYEVELKKFLINALKNNCPVAFMNLDRGEVNNLDSWHWITLVELNSDSFCAVAYDNCERIEIDIGLWLRTMKSKGGFVAAEVFPLI